MNKPTLVFTERPGGGFDVGRASGTPALCDRTLAEMTTTHLAAVCFLWHKTDHRLNLAKYRLKVATLFAFLAFSALILRLFALGD